MIAGYMSTDIPGRKSFASHMQGRLAEQTQTAAEKSAPDLGAVLLNWKRKCKQSEEGWVFPSSVTGRCYHASPIQQDYIRPAGRKLGLGDIGWHTFRHTYRSWLDLVGTPIGVQQKLMRHAQIATTMNVYGNAMMESKREANSKVVQMALRQEAREAK